MLPNIGAPELIIILIVLLLVVGPGKLPEIGSAFGKTLREFRKASSELQETAESATRLSEPPKPQPATQAASATSTAAAAPAAPVPNQLSEPVGNANVITSDTDPEAVGVAKNVSPRGTPEDAIEDA
jgi:sec-independent protein translocase protein TatA